MKRLQVSTLPTSNNDQPTNFVIFRCFDSAVRCKCAMARIPENKKTKIEYLLRSCDNGPMYVSLFEKEAKMESSLL